MFCSKCGGQMSDDAAFCPKCGVPTPSPQPPPADVSTAPSQVSSVLESDGIASGPKGEINKGKVILDIALNMIIPFIAGAAGVLALGWLGTQLINSFSDKYSLSMGDIPGFYSVMIRSGFFAAFLSIIPKAIVIKRRINDPDDIAYIIGSDQDEETNKKFEKKHHKFESVTEWILTIAVIIFAIYSLVVEFNNQYGDEMQDALNSTSSNSSVSAGTQEDGYTSMEPSSTPAPIQGDTQKVTDTTYFVDSDPQGATIILEPDGTCAYLMFYATSMAHYYGDYEMTTDSIILHLTLDDGSALNIPFENRGSSLAYTGAEAIRLTYPGAVYDRSDEVPDSVQYYPPYTEGALSGAATVILAQVTADPTLRLREQPTADSYVSAEIPYGEIVEIVYQWDSQIEWTMVQYAGMPGWVSTEYLELYSIDAGSLTEQEARSLLEQTTASMPNAEGSAPMVYYGVIETSGRIFQAFWMSDVAGEGGEDLYAVNAQSGGVHIIRLSDNAYMPFASYYGALFGMTDPWTGESLVW